MLIDRFRMRRDLKRKNQREKLSRAIDRSRDLAARRAQSVPSVTYPQALPVAGSVEEIKDAISANQVVIVAGETGSGKTTQLPKICLQAGRGVTGMIGHTQPRRVAARTIAHRLAEELDVEVGEAVGYQVRFQDQTRPETLIKVMTDGVMLAETANDRFLERYDTIIIDEAHERSLNIDFLLGYIKRILPKRPDLRVIITSATIDVDRFSRHFDRAPVIEVSGRTFPVEIEYRPVDDADQPDGDDALSRTILEVLSEIETMARGDVLIFLPGEREIREVATEIKKQGPAGFNVLPLYSRLGVAEQNRVFAAHTDRRIVLATNVAETSLTVPGIKYVIDPGLARVSRYSFRSKVQQLPVEAVSQASANQRAGRCGRVSDGVCFRLYTEEDFSERPEFTEPEILRTNLASVILQMLQLRLGDIERFPFVERPNQKQINDGFALLYELGAVDRNRKITRLGKQLARFPVDLRFGRMLVAASNTGCLREVLLITSALTVQDPRERPFDKQQAADAAHRQYLDERSDFLALVNLWNDYEGKRQSMSQGQLRRYCKTQFLSFMRLREWREMHRQLLLLCRELGFKENQKPAGYDAVHKALLSGLLGHIAVKAGENDYQGARNRKQFIFPGSSQFSRKPGWIMSAELVETSRLFARTVAQIDSRWVEPLAGHLVTRTHHDPVFDETHAQVMVREEVALYGIVIINNRMIDYGVVDQINARELFIEKALVQGALRSRLKFFQQNRRLIADIERLESKVRKRDILIESRALYDFYDQMLPLDISSEIDLRTFVNASESNARSLELSRRELMQREARLSEAQFPNRLSVGNTALPLKYKFEPGMVDDGVTVDVPLVLLKQVPREQLDWIVPGLLEEKCLALIKSLPKSVRKRFVPAPDYVARVLEDFEYDGSPLVEALANRLFRISGTRVDARDFKPDSLDHHLTLNIRVVDDKGKQLATGRDVEALLADLGEKVSQRLDERGVHELEQSGLVDWSLDDLPESIVLKEGRVSVTLYPALIDELDSVAVQLLESAAKAQRASRQGLLRLLLLQLAEQRRYLEKNIPGFERFSLYYATRGNRATLTESIVKAAFTVTFIDHQPMVRNRAEFLSRIERRDQLFEHLEEVARVTALVLKQSLSIEDRIKGVGTALVVSDIQQQLNGLLGPAFPADVPTEWLRHYPRYLRGILQRLDQLNGNVGRDTQAIAQVDIWWQRYLSTDQDTREKLVKFRWMIEEYRISLFAQSIGTSLPVSDKRLAKEWASIMGRAS